MTSFDNVVDATRQNANSGSELARAAGQIIAKRVALGVAAIIDPMRADHAELGRMVPEKIEAFSDAGMIMMQQVSHALEQIARFASDATGTATRARLAIVGSANPSLRSSAVSFGSTRMSIRLSRKAAWSLPWRIAGW